MRQTSDPCGEGADLTDTRPQREPERLGLPDGTGPHLGERVEARPRDRRHSPLIGNQAIDGVVPVIDTLPALRRLSAEA